MNWKEAKREAEVIGYNTGVKEERTRIKEILYNAGVDLSSIKLIDNGSLEKN